MRHYLYNLGLVSFSLWALTFEQLNSRLTVVIGLFTAVWMLCRAVLEVIKLIEKIKEKRGK